MVFVGASFLYVPGLKTHDLGLSGALGSQVPRFIGYWTDKVLGNSTLDVALASQHKHTQRLCLQQWAAIRSLRLGQLRHQPRMCLAGGTLPLTISASFRDGKI